MKKIIITSRGSRTSLPSLRISLQGVISITPLAASILGVDPGGSIDLLQDDDNQFYIGKGDTYKFHKSDLKFYNRSLTTYLIHQMDLPLADNKRKSVRLDVDTKATTYNKSKYYRIS